ncbi:GNAT family N-acetyltransferase [Halomarina ordinaria]|uniref:GNAT family N-acetyltransferase n=1 Tax=Halomarina ordinaria TaxID=3033939 RepID=A0ABD5UC81_9EURY|nr:GNAT family N-acetyltransferase [Halomarina sp. PSRA2]
MYVRDAKNREEVWLLDHIEAMDLDDRAFRSRDYVIAIDEESNARAGFGRIRIHNEDGDAPRSASGRRSAAGDYCEVTSIGVLDGWRGQGVAAHVVERLVSTAADRDFESVYVLTDQPNYFTQFGFRAVEADTLPDSLRERHAEKRDAREDPVVALHLDVDRFRMPERLRERFKTAAERGETTPEEDAEDFGIDPESATYKYDTGR